MNFFATFTAIAMGLVVCLVALAHAGGDKSAKTTVSINPTRVRDLVRSEKLNNPKLTQANSILHD